MHRLARLAAVAAAAAVLPIVPHAGAATSHSEITGSGSSWAYNAVNQWIADVDKNGLQVVFTSTGSAQGRKDFAYKSTDFAVSDIAYQGRDPLTGQLDTSLGRQYAYLPIVAGGTSFPYHLGNGASQIKNLRLSGQTLAKIFTNQVTRWNDPAIAADNNNQLNLPNLRITPVVHSEGSGSTAQFTRFLAKQYPSIWSSFSGADLPTEYYPKQGSQVGQNGSDGVMNFISSAAGNGTIGFDEYSYPLLSGVPVAKILNSNGYYTAPTQYNVAVALTAAQINNDPSSPDYLTQNLDNVYRMGDPRAYPLSSYSYAIIPTGSNNQETKTNTTAARQTIADFLYYSICQGQSEIGPVGYSALPINLVQAGFAQIGKLRQADSAVDLTSRDVSTCNNPTFIAGQPNVNHLAQIAPQPPSCDHQGVGPCLAGIGVLNSNPINGKAPAQTAGAVGMAGAGAGGAGAGTSAAGAGGPAGAASRSGDKAGATGIDPNTGQQVATDSGGATDVQGASADLAPAAQNSTVTGAMGFLAVVLLIAVLVVPVLVARAAAGRRP